MPLVWAAVRWLGVLGLGWLGSDLYNESQTTSQVTAASVVGTVKRSFMSRAWVYVVMFIIIVLGLFLAKRFKLIKKV